MKKLLKILFIIPLFYFFSLIKYANDFIFYNERIEEERIAILIIMVIITLMLSLIAFIIE